jgi:hypothetical protein
MNIDWQRIKSEWPLAYELCKKEIHLNCVSGDYLNLVYKFGNTNKLYFDFHIKYESMLIPVPFDIIFSLLEKILDKNYLIIETFDVLENIWGYRVRHRKIILMYEIPFVRYKTRDEAKIQAIYTALEILSSQLTERGKG